MTRLALGLVCALLAVPQAASAATVTLEYEEPIPGLAPESVYALSITGGPREANRLAIYADPDGYTVDDTGAALQPGDGCRALNSKQVRCDTPQAATEHSVFVDAGDSGDQVILADLLDETTTEVRGGSGADLIFGWPGADLIFGGSGDDGIAAGPGFDRVDGGPGDDTLQGGDGFDRVSYQSREAPIRVDLATGAGGSDGETDTLAGIEEVVGGRGADHIAGDAGDNNLVGGEGDARDTLFGRGGDDALVGRRVVGGSGADGLDGLELSCGAGHDVVYRGLYRGTGPYPRACEAVLSVFVFLSARPLSLGPRHATFGVTCRGDGCRGELALFDARGRLGRARFTAPAGVDRVERVRIPLARRAGRLATLRVRGPRAYQRDRYVTRLR